MKVPHRNHLNGLKLPLSVLFLCMCYVVCSVHALLAQEGWVEEAGGNNLVGNWKKMLLRSSSKLEYILNYEGKAIQLTFKLVQYVAT